MMDRCSCIFPSTLLFLSGHFISIFSKALYTLRYIFNYIPPITLIASFFLPFQTLFSKSTWMVTRDLAHLVMHPIQALVLQSPFTSPVPSYCVPG
jgi:hypothetical protein